jgi:hypothetical protein
MATYSKVQLSGGTTGKNVKVAATSTPGTTIHTAHATDIDEIWLWAVNSDTSDRKLTIEFGGVSAPDDLVEFTVPTEDGPYLIIPGWTLTNSLVVKAFAASANVIVINGFVNRITA